MENTKRNESPAATNWRISGLPKPLLAQLEELAEKTIKEAMAADHSCAQQELCVDFEWLGFTFYNVEVTVFACVGLLPSRRPSVVNVSASVSWFDIATKTEVSGYAEGLVIWGGASIRSAADAWYLAIEEAFWDLADKSPHIDRIFDAFFERGQLSAAVPAFDGQLTPGEKARRL